MMKAGSVHTVFHLPTPVLCILGDEVATPRGVGTRGGVAPSEGGAEGAAGGPTPGEDAVDTFLKEKLKDLGGDTYIELERYLATHPKLDRNFLAIGFTMCREGLPTTARQQSLKVGEILRCVLPKELEQQAIAGKPCVYAKIAGPVKRVQQDDQSVRS